MRIMLALALSLCLSTAALAQEETAPATTQPTTQPEKPVGDPIFGGADLSVDEVMERLRRMLGLYSPLGPNGPAVVINTPEARRGDILISVPVAPRRVGRLTTDLVQQGGWFTRERVVMPAGTPVFNTRFYYSVTSNYGVVLQSTNYDAWCGVVAEGRRQREVSYCALTNGSARQVSASTGGSPWWPRNMSPPVDANQFEVTEDQSVLSEFPRLELIYTFVEFDNTDADVRRGIRVNGGELVEINNVSLALQADASSVLRVAGGELRLRRSGDRRLARIEVVQPPRAYDPDEEEAQLRAIAERYVARAQERAAAAAQAAPSEPPPAAEPTPPPTQ